MTDPIKHLTEMQLDTLREISNIGMGHAATALSQLVNQPVKITVPKARVVDVFDVPSVIGGEDVEVAAAYVQVIGEVRGHLVLVFPVPDAHKIIDLIAPGHQMNIMVDELARSAVQEIGNILCSSFLRSLSDMTQLNILPTVPAVAVDFAGSIVSYVVANMYELTEQLVIVETDFDIGGERIAGHNIFIPEPGSLRTILRALGMGGGDY